MAFAGNFTVSQGADLSSLTFVDTSTGSDTNITSRRIYPRNSAGVLVLPTGNTTGYIDWPLPLGTNLTVNLLVKDLALNIQVIWISSAPIGGSTYDITNLNVNTKYTKTFLYNRSEDLAAQESLKNDKEWFSYYNKLQGFVDTAELAATADINDVQDAQTALDMAFYIMSHQNLFF